MILTPEQVSGDVAATETNKQTVAQIRERFAKNDRMNCRDIMDLIEHVGEVARSYEELRQRAETAERELDADLSYRERWQQARDEKAELQKRVEELEKGVATWKSAASSGFNVIAELTRQLEEERARLDKAPHTNECRIWGPKGKAADSNGQFSIAARCDCWKSAAARNAAKEQA